MRVVGEVLEDSRAGTKAGRLLARMQICVVCGFCSINKGQVVLGSLAKRSSRVSTATGASLLFPATLDAARHFNAQPRGKSL